ncbi:hypothetical protein LSM04_002153 [Trypanosoma melophagium]|uniref:uncharacterized protein n=1 Tax=Trypanosoma melophagium TaxID=715481 RepID=UPI003519FEEC|nr:hypothetical protein LSM04_002153 [Trypanosoma melophagium]
MTTDSYTLAVDKSLENLHVGDFVAVATQRADAKEVHWTLGTVESAPYKHDIEVRLWEKRREEPNGNNEQEGGLETEEGRELVERIERVKRELAESMRQAAELTQHLRERRQTILDASNEAEKHVAQSRAAVHLARSDVDKISYRHWQELKSYRLPPKMVTSILRAVMLLLGEDDAATWPQMQRVLRDAHFKSRIIEYDPGDMLTTERCEYILRECVGKKSFQYNRAVHGSQAMGPIYYWVLAQLDSFEAAREQHRVEKKMAAQKKELREVMKEIREQQQRMAEYQSMMEKADEQLLAYRERQRETVGDGSSVSNSEIHDAALEQYKRSFAGAANKKYLLPAFYTWQPTDYIIVVMRRNTLVGFGPLSEQQKEGNDLSESQIRLLDAAIQRNQRSLNSLSQNNEERNRRIQQEEAELEEGIFKTTIDENKESAALMRDLLQRQFEGENWKGILDHKRADIVNTFVEETTEATKLPGHKINVLDVKYCEQPASLMVDTEVLHDGSRSKKELKKAIDSYPYPKMNALYNNTSSNSTEHNMLFRGELWEQILQENKEEVNRAFKKDTARALDLKDKNDISIQSTLYDNGLYVVYNVQSTNKWDEEITSAVDAYDYPEIWTLYASSQAKEPVILEKVFNGNNWEETLEKEKSKVTDAFQKDSSKALGLPKQNVKVEFITATDKSLNVKYTTQDERRGPQEVTNVLDKCTYPAVWGLYKNDPTDKSSWIETKHETQFEGEDWDITLEQIEPKLQETVASETARALKCDREDVTEVKLHTTPKSLHAVIKIRHDSSIQTPYIKNKITNYPYNEVWMLYKPRPFSEHKRLETTHEFGFEGEEWEYVVEQRPWEVEEALASETARALGCERGDITGVELDPAPQALIAFVTIQHGPQLQREHIKELLQQHEYTKLWQLYAQRPEEDDTNVESTHELGFEGEEWEYVVEQRPWEVEEALASGTARALGCERGNITGVELDPAPQALIAFVTVRHSPQLQTEQIKTKLTEYDYDELWALYEGRPLESSELTRKFEGDDWDLVVGNNRGKLEDAFCKETADALDVSPNQVVVTNCRIGSLLVDFKVRGCRLSDEEMLKRTDAHEYREVYALYAPRVRGAGDASAAVGRRSLDNAAGAGDLVVTAHHVGFEGPGWEGVLAEKQQDLLQAFVGDTAEYLSVDKDDVFDTVMTYADGGLRVDFDLRHPTTLSEENVNVELEACKYKTVWALYEERPVETTHELGFKGEDWGYVVEQHRGKVEEALASDTARALGCEREDITGVELDPAPQALIAFVTVRHSPQLQTEQIMESLQKCEYKAVWALYEEQPLESSELTRKFEGDDWDLVVGNNRGKLEDAFCKETADALDVSPNQVVVTNCRIGSLLVDFKVRGCRLSDEEMLKRTDAHEYREVYALYAPRVRGAGDASAAVGRRSLDNAAGAGDLVVTAHHVGFEGPGWEGVLAEKQQDLLQAFVGDTAEYLSVDKDDVFDTVMTYADGGLRVDFDLRHPTTLSEENVNVELEACKYKTVWALYEERPVETTHELGFEGEDWGYVVEQHRGKVEEALASDTARALGCERGDITGVELDPAPQALIAFVTVRHSPQLQTEQIMESLQKCEYKAVWALYEEQPLESSELTRKFEGDDWDLVVGNNRGKLEDAFCKETADALDVSPNQVVVTNCRIGSLLVDFKVRGCRLSDEEMLKRTDAHEYREVYALYAPRVRGAGDASAAVGRRSLDNAAGAGDLVVTAHHVGFEGPGWEGVLAEKQQDLLQAFVGDTAEYLSVDKDDVFDTVMTYADGGLRVDFDLRHPTTLSEENVNVELEACKYKTVWALYEERPVETTHELGFEGEDWGYVVEQHRGKVEEALASDTARALGCERGDITGVELDPAPQALIAFVTVRHSPQLQTEQIMESLQKCEYKAVWALYEEQPLESSELTRKFEGDDWDLVVGNNRGKLEDAFCKETADALDVSPNQVVVTNCRIGSLLVDFKVRGCRLSDEEMLKRTDAHEYREVYALYAPRVRGAGDASAAVGRRSLDNAAGAGDLVVTAHHVGFEGPGWEGVLAEKQQDLLQAFVGDTAEYLSVDKDDVFDTVMTYADGGLRVDFDLRHPTTLSEENVNVELEACKYKTVWALYEERPVETTHELGFEGEDWGYVVEQHRGKVEEALASDTARALGCEREDITGVELDPAPQALIAFVTVRHSPQLQTEQIMESLQKCEYKAVWALYEEQPLESSELTRKFEGDDWDLVVGNNRGKLEDAFRKETADALDVSPNQVVVTNCRIGSLLVDFKVRGCRLSDEEMLKRTDAHEYREVYALYAPRVRGAGDASAAVGRRSLDNAAGAGDLVVTAHHVGFEGPGWEGVLAEKQQDLLQAFVGDTAEYLSVDKDDVFDTVMTYADGGLRVDFDLRHPTTLSEENVNVELEACKYKTVWALYEERPVETTHELGFEGEDWGYVVEQHRGKVEEALASDTARALGCERGDITGVELDPAPQALIAFVTVRHSPQLQTEQIMESLQKCEYKAVWALYEEQPLESSELTRKFEGDDWDLVVGNNRGKLEDAFCKETADALDVSPNQVVVTNCRIGSLLVDFKVRGCRLSDEEMLKRTDAHEYREVYALYAPRVRGAGDASAAVGRRSLDNAAGAGDLVVTAHHVGFEGPGWEGVLAEKQQDLLQAFVGDTAEYLSVDKDDVFDTVMTYADGGLRVDFDLRHPTTLSEENVNVELEACKYKTVWALYEERPVETTHELGFEGEDWGYVVEQHRGKVEEALASDTARALGCERGDITGVELDPAPQALIAFVTVRHSPQLQTEQIMESLQKCEYKAVWALYEEQPLESSELTRKFEGDDWDLVVGNNRGKLEDAFCKETADALDVSPNQVVVTNCRIGSLLVDFKVRGCRLSDEEMLKRTDAHEYREVYALYAPRVRGAGDASAAVGRRSLDNAAGAGDLVVTAHHVGFEGPGWEGVLAEKQQDLLQAFVGDTAEYLSVDKDDVFDTVMTYADGGLRVDFDLRHPTTLSEENVNVELEACKYKTVWALYEERPVETTHELGFEGEDWGYVVEQHRGKVEEALASDTARALGCERGDITGVELDPAPQALIAFVTVRHSPQLQTEQIMESLQKCEYKAVWAFFAACLLLRRLGRKLENDLEAEEEARRLEAASEAALREARYRPESSLKASESAKQNEDAAVLVLLEVASHSGDAAVRAEAFAEWSRRKDTTNIISAEEVENETEQVTYLRNALAQARRERDEYRDLLDEEEQRREKRGSSLDWRTRVLSQVPY